MAIERACAAQLRLMSAQSHANTALPVLPEPVVRREQHACDTRQLQLLLTDPHELLHEEALPVN
jgi:hypothetical protein